ncbi:hypothetical protein GCM10007904_28910 [Oharaeibacter diazotrophicus]|nr:hypothetical protein GCM10007904_28910 [Oharaeibacter diazotrophicus]
MVAGVLVLAPLHAPSGLVDDLVAAHVRSLQVDHLTDVPTSDRHTVKPWFAGKVAFSPPVVDLADRGFPLVGGRVDYVGHRTVAAIVYRRHGHVINLFVWPADAPAAGDAAFREEGYNVVRWEQGGLVHYAVGDVDPAELDAFRAAAAARAPD